MTFGKQKKNQCFTDFSAYFIASKNYTIWIEQEPCSAALCFHFVQPEGGIKWDYAETLVKHKFFVLFLLAEYSKILLTFLMN